MNKENTSKLWKIIQEAGDYFKGWTLIELRAENSITTIAEIRQSFLRMNLGMTYQLPR